MPVQKNLNGVILTPNQKIVFEKATKKMIPTIIENPIVVNPPETRTSFVFEETPLPEVLEKLKKAYAIEILVQNPAMNKCVFTADLNELSLYKQLDLICKAVNSTYEQRGTSIFINGDGCN
jgi:transmembrane sensor